MCRNIMLVGPLPPPTNGQSLTTNFFVSGLLRMGVSVRTLNLSEGMAVGLAGKIVRIFKHLWAFIVISASRDAVYISANSNSGIWLTVFLICAGRLRRRQLAVHYHSYALVRERRISVALGAICGGKDCIHIVLCNRMGEDLRTSVPEAKRVFVLNNGGLLDVAFIGLQPFTKSAKFLRLGHLSNLCAEKGIIDVVEFVIKARQRGMNVRLVIAGPKADAVSVSAIRMARKELGSAFEYRGPVYGKEKLIFFEDIDFFLFPSTYVNEAYPIVLLESLAAGVPVIAKNIGCIGELVGEAGGLAITNMSQYIDDGLAYLEQSSSGYAEVSAAARRRFESLAADHQSQMSELGKLLVIGREGDRGKS